MSFEKYNYDNSLIEMMFKGVSIDTFKSLWEKDRDSYNWEFLLHMCYCEESYESVGGDDGDMEDPPINEKKLAYLRDLMVFLEKMGIKEEECED